MLKNIRVRRGTAVFMLVLGAVLMFLAPEIWQGVLVFFAGVAVELIGIALEHKAKNSS